MKTLFIHIGPLKTGTTAIQSFMFVNRSELKKQGILYPGQYENHYPVAHELGTFEAPYLDNASQTYQVFSEIVQNINSYQKFVLSSEGFCENMDQLITCLLSTIEFFKIDIEVKIIVFCRPQPEWLLSAYQQLIKESSVRESDTFESFVLRKPYDNIANYHMLLNRWSTYFGKENIHLALFTSKQPRSKIFFDFCAILGLEIKALLVEPTIQSSNIGLGTDAVEFLRLINLLEINTNQFERIRNVISSFGKSNVVSYSLLTTQLNEKILQYYSQANRMVANEYLCSSDVILFGDLDTVSTEDMFSTLTSQKVINLESITRQLEIIKVHDIEVLSEIYIQLVQTTSPSVLYYDVKESFKQILEKLIPQEKLDLLRKIPRYTPDNIEQLRLFEESSLLLAITTSNFLCKTNDFSNHITINIESDVRYVEVNSSGSDPYFSLEKCFGNYDSVTLVRIKIEVPENTFLKLYYQTRHQPKYSEDLSTEVLMKKGLNYAFLEISNPDFNGQLRLDPGNTVGSYNIHEILVKSNARSYDELFHEIKMLKSNIIKY